MSKTKSQSGLGSIKRDWSVNSVGGPKSSQEIEWLPTPPKPVVKAQPELTGREKRLRDIQNALASRSTPAVAQPFATKRLSDTEYPDASHPTKKPRQLPPGYDDPITQSTNFASSSRTAKAQSTYTAPPQSTKKMAGVFLSQEQQQILKLVQEGTSVFYTGSAGTKSCICTGGRGIDDSVFQEPENPSSCAR
ncbi:hypothetical protein C8R43DRAFT_905203 [Mycena crocata]|nr:hypothetical protein C8R43DRAFT_905203 [Mycena crocata]